MSELNGHQPDANASFAGSYHGQWAQHHNNPYRGNQWYDGPTPPNTNLRGQNTYQMNPNIGNPTLGNAQQTHFPPGPSRREYDTLPLAAPAPVIPDDGVRDRLPIVSDAPDVFSSDVPESVPPRIRARERMKRLAHSYLNDPNAKVDALCMELKPSIGRLRVQITLDIDVGVDAN
ncbi:hypothetical protein V8E53_007909 [Lactarius tabidus]